VSDVTCEIVLKSKRHRSKSQGFIMFDKKCAITSERKAVLFLNVLKVRNTRSAVSNRPEGQSSRSQGQSMALLTPSYSPQDCYCPPAPLKSLDTMAFYKSNYCYYYFKCYALRSKRHIINIIIIVVVIHLRAHRGL